MADIVQLQQPQPMTWVCECGCSTFTLLSDGTAQCAGCDADHEALGSGWLDRSKDRRTLYEEADTFTDVQGNGSTIFARRRIARIAADEDAAMIVVAKEDGRISAWSIAETEDQVAWAHKKLTQAADLIGRKDVSNG
ncbi:hypothetical protein [Paracoccus marcusii]|uniref:hypothetical protein n=1 Tax=Paracoccus marcusii TaxID=59779 RepID=UPI00111274A1|nr:hypothetical protein [Paracoccus marcusii]TNC05553.1 hypothetical protein FHD68_03590 [Paracoccus marcusii]